MILDIILPTLIEVTPDDKVTLDYKNDEVNYENEECTLQLNFEHDGRIVIDYYSDGDRYIMEDLFPDFDNECTAKSFIQKQYEIATKLKIKTTDVLV